MKLLFLTPSALYPSRSGTALRNWGLIRELALRHEITLLSFADPQAPDMMQIPDLNQVKLQETVLVPFPPRSRPARVFQQFSRRPDLSYRLVSSKFDSALRALLQSRTFDVIQIEGLEMANALKVIRANSTRTRVVHDAHNVEYAVQRSAYLTDLKRPRRWAAALYSMMQWPRLRRYEADVCRQADLVCCVSDQDAQDLRKIAPTLRPVVIPNGLRLDDYSFVPREHLESPSEQSAAAEGQSLVFTGKMDYRPNVDAADWFVREILPLIHARVPEVRFAIVGQKPHRDVARYAKHARVLIVGAVPDVRPYIAGAAVYVMPLRMGGGTRFKLLEAMALGIPVVSTREGAEGFSVTHERELLIADSAQDFAQAVLRLLDDKNLREALSRSGRRFVEAGYDWSAIVPRLEAAYRECVCGDG